MDVFRQVVHIVQETFLVIRWIEFGKADIQIEVIRGRLRCNGLQRLLEKRQRLWNSIRPAAAQSLYDTLAGVQYDLLLNGLWKPSDNLFNNFKALP